MFVIFDQILQVPLYKKIFAGETKVIIWIYDENETFDNLELSDNDCEKMENLHPKKRAEFLMVRRILHDYLPGEKITYDENGQPFLQKNNLKISVSHTFPLAGIAFSDEEVGLDIEKITTKISAIKHKFLHSSEVLYLPESAENEYLTVIWTAKEALYKLHKSKLWSLKNHYKVSPFSISDDFQVNASVFAESWEDFFTVNVYKTEDYFISVASKS